jgi:hypothetical protein
VAICHCDDCQRHGGGAFSVNLVVPRAALTISGTPRAHKTVSTEGGHERERMFCGDCGSPLFTMLADQPEIAAVKAGTLDDHNGYAPGMEFWTRSAQGWVTPDSTRVLFEGDPQLVG